MSTNAPVVAIDGPSGSGKGTIARRVARSLGFHLLDSGALYRLTALAVQERQVDSANPEAVAAVAEELEFRFEHGEAEDAVTLNGRDVTKAIRSESISKIASTIAVQAPLRAALLERQREFRRPPGLVADGRDMGSVVFPDAEVKIYLTAAAEERARRRYKQLIEKGIDVSLPALVEDIAERDKRDSSRSVAPLRAAADAELLDTSGTSIEEIVSRVLKITGQRLQR